MKELLAQYSERAPEIVFEWTDAETGAKGWVVINSLENVQRVRKFVFVLFIL